MIFNGCSPNFTLTNSTLDCTAKHHHFASLAHLRSPLVLAVLLVAHFGAACFGHVLQRGAAGLGTGEQGALSGWLPGHLWVTVTHLYHLLCIKWCGQNQSLHHMRFSWKNTTKIRHCISEHRSLQEFNCSGMAKLFLVVIVCLQPIPSMLLNGQWFGRQYGALSKTFYDNVVSR